MPTCWVCLTDLRTRRLVTGLVMSYAGVAIAYKSKVQTTVATSSTEAEFLAAVTAAKIAKYLRAVLKGLGCEQKTATILYEDNETAIAMVNENKPTVAKRAIDMNAEALIIGFATVL
jgi:hypothetical protein